MSHFEKKTIKAFSTKCRIRRNVIFEKDVFDEIRAPIWIFRILSKMAP